MKTNKKLLYIFILSVLIILTVLPLSAYPIPEKTVNFYVADYADVIDNATEIKIINGNDILFESTGAQIVIVTVNGIGGENMETYANRIFNEWGIGDAERNNGLLFLMSVGDDDYWAVSGSGLENTLSAGTIGNILDYDVEPYFAAKDYSNAALAFYDSAYERIMDIYGSTSYYPSDSQQTNGENNSFSISGMIGGLFSWIIGAGKIILVLIVIVIIAVVGSLSRTISHPFSSFHRPHIHFSPFIFSNFWHHRGPRHGPPPRNNFRGGMGNSRGPTGNYGRSNRTSTRPRSGGGGSTRGGGAGRGRR